MGATRVPRVPRLAVPLVGAALGLAILFVIVNMLAFSPGTSSPIPESAALAPGSDTAAAPVDSVEPARSREAGAALEEARARWFALVYEGRNFEAGPDWEPAHP